MRVETNWKLVQRNRRIANFLFFFSMAVLIGGFFSANLQLTANDSTSMALALILPWIVLPIGFISTITSVKMTNTWLRRPRPEDALREGLKGMSKRSVLYNYYHFPARHVLITPQGVFAITVRYQEGSYIVEGDRWKTIGGALSRFMRFFRRDDIGNPIQEALRSAAHVKSLLEKVTPGIEVQPLIVFTDPRAQLQIMNPTIPVLYVDGKKEPNLRDYMRQIGQRQQPKEEIKKKSGTKSKQTDKTSDEQGVIAPEEFVEAFEELTLSR
jgi:hypothetical protein